MGRTTAAIRLLVKLDPAFESRLKRVALANDPEIEVIARVDDPIEVLVTVKQESINVVVLADEQQDTPGLSSHLLAEFPDVTVLALDASGQAWIEQRCHRRWCLPSGTRLAPLLRDVVLNPCEFNWDFPD